MYTIYTITFATPENCSCPVPTENMSGSRGIALSKDGFNVCSFWKQLKLLTAVFVTNVSSFCIVLGRIDFRLVMKHCIYYTVGPPLTKSNPRTCSEYFWKPHISQTCGALGRCVVQTLWPCVLCVFPHL